MQQIFQHRAGLSATQRALAAGQLTVGFIGGSITDPRPGNNWPEPVSAWFVEHWPQARINVENAAIGATGSELAVFRAERDLIQRGCDLVFVEFAADDHGEPSDKRQQTREGLLRKLLAGEGRDVVLVYTFLQAMYAEIRDGQVPASIAEFEQLGEHYRLGSVWVGLHALREVEAGRMRWEEWLPDGLHPQFRGSLSFAQCVIQFLERELGDTPGPARGRLPDPLHPLHWERAHRLPLADVRWTGPWSVRRWAHDGWIDQVLSTSAPGAKIAFRFTGRALTLGIDFNKYAADFRYRLDGGAWQIMNLTRPAWVGALGWYRTVTIATDLPAGPHEFELEVVHDSQPECGGTNFRLALIGVVP